MQLRFELGDPQAPRGHAILFGRTLGSDPRVVATYCVVLPIEFTLAKYLPPMLAGQMAAEGLRDVGGINAVPMPPMLEDVASVAALHSLAQHRGDDLCDIGPLSLADDAHRVNFAAEACAEYAQLFAAYRQRWPELPADAPAEAPPELDVDEVMASVLPERQRIEEIARLIGQARYAIEVHDRRQLEEATTGMQRLARSLPEKYRASQMVAEALRTDESGPRVAELYVQRAFRLLDEDYASIPPLEQEIRAVREARGDDA